MASLSVGFHFIIIYTLIFVLYIGLCANLYFNYYSNFHHDLISAKCDKQSSLLISEPLISSESNESVISEKTNESVTESNGNVLAKTTIKRKAKRQANIVHTTDNGFEFDKVQDDNALTHSKNGSLPFENEFLSSYSMHHQHSGNTFHHHHHHHHLRHKGKLKKARSTFHTNNPISKSLNLEDDSDKDGPSIEFFQKPQTVAVDTEKYEWLSGYSRIPVSSFHFHFIFLFSYLILFDSIVDFDLSYFILFYLKEYLICNESHAN